MQMMFMTLKCGPLRDLCDKWVWVDSEDKRRPTTEMSRYRSSIMWSHSLAPQRGGWEDFQSTAEDENRKEAVHVSCRSDRCDKLTPGGKFKWKLWRFSWVGSLWGGGSALIWCSRLSYFGAVFSGFCYKFPKMSKRNVKHINQAKVSVMDLLQCEMFPVNSRLINGWPHQLIHDEGQKKTFC